jgi:transcription initiation factor TFIID TATA-box-binding protein
LWLSSHIKARIVNVVASFSFPHRIDVHQLAEALGVELVKLSSRGALIAARVRMGNAYLLVYHTGRVVCVGATSEREARAAARKLIKLLKSKGFLVEENGLEVKVLNVVASIELGCPVDIESLAERLERCIYEPEIFPGLILSDRWTYLVFANGKANVLGMKSESELDQAVSHLIELIDPSRRV